MKKLFLLLAIALVIPVSTHCGENNDQRFSKTAFLVGGTMIVVIGYGAYNYYFPSSPALPTIDNQQEKKSIHQEQKTHTLPPADIRLNKLTHEDPKKLEDLLNPSKKPAPAHLPEKTSNADAKPAPIVQTAKKEEPTKILNPEPKELPKAILAEEKTTKSASSSYGEVLCNAFEKMSNRSNPTNVDHATNDYLDIIVGY